MAIFNVDPDPILPNENPQSELILPTSDPDPIGTNKNSGLDRSVRNNGESGVESRNPKVESILPNKSKVINIVSPLLRSTDLILPNDGGLTFEGPTSMEMISELANDPRYSIYNNGEILQVSNLINNEVNPILPDNHDINGDVSYDTKLMLGSSQSKVQLNPDGSLKSLGSIGNSYYQKVLNEYYQRRELQRGLATRIAESGTENVGLGNQPLWLHNFTSQDPTTNKHRNQSLVAQSYILSFSGHKDLTGLSLGSNHLWDISMDNYKVNGITFAPKVPSLIKTKKGSLGNFIPATSYTYNGYEVLTKNIEIFNESEIEFIKGIKRGNTLEIELLEDQNMTWTRYFDLYHKRVVDEENNCVAPYKQTVLKISIMSYNCASKIFFLHRLLCIPTDYSYIVKGEESPSEQTLSVKFSVVGDEDTMFKLI